MTTTTSTFKFEFTAPEYQADGSFVETPYSFEGNETDGWLIRRNNEDFDRLGPGYTAVKSLYCGVCSTDLARRFLPYPLPQIIGHEVVALDSQERPVVVEINASYKARGIAEKTDPYNSSMHTHDPRRITLGINQLPGGFSPVLLAPTQAVISIPKNVTPLAASLTEPFAAALQGVEATHPRTGDRVAVLGPRRLGSLILAALSGFRQKTKLDFRIVAVARHQRLLDLALELGADEAIDNSKASADDLKGAFDVVYDTTGKPEGFAAALEMTKRVLHLKSTNGQEVMGLKHLTDMVVDEIALLPCDSAERLDYTWPNEETKRTNPNVFVSPGVAEDQLFQQPQHTYHRLASAKEAQAKIEQQDTTTPPSYPPGSPFGRFDLAVASNLAEVDAILRPTEGQEFSILRARGAVLLTKAASYDSELHRAVAERGISVHTSRCGNFGRALDLWSQNPKLAEALEKHLITHKFELKDIDEAFSTAADSGTSVKVIVKTTGTVNDRKRKEVES